MSLTRRVVLSALALAVSIAAVYPASAHNKVSIGAGGATAKSTMIFKIEGVQNPGPCGPYINEDLWGPGDGSNEHFCLGLLDPANNKAVGRAIYQGPGTAASTASYCYGDAQLGGDNGIETLPDSAMACVGLYQAPGGTALGSNPDSTLRVVVTRTAGNVQLTVPTIVVGGVSVGSGGMQVRAASGSETSIAEFRLIVYPDQTAADGDINNDGFGSAFTGRCVLETGQGVPTGLSTYGGFAQSDFIVQDQGGGKYTLRPVAGLTKNVPVANSANAVVVLFSDPRMVARPVAVPSNTPMGLGLLALALMAGGIWVIRSRRTAETA
jgi:hypothetical protein